MPALPDWAGFTDDTLNADEFSVALWSTQAPDDSFDILNGGLDHANWALAGTPGNAGKLPMWSIQPGAFAAGYYYGFDRREIILAEQGVAQMPGYTIPANHFGYGLIGSMSHTVFLPFDAETVIFGYQAWCKHNLVYWYGADTIAGGGDDIFENVYIVPYITGTSGTQTPYNTMACKLPHYAHSAGEPDDTITTTSRWEFRWRQISGSGMTTAATTNSSSPGTLRGPLTFQLFVYGNVQPPNKLPQTLIIDSGGIYLLAIR